MGRGEGPPSPEHRLRVTEDTHPALLLVPLKKAKKEGERKEMPDERGELLIPSLDPILFVVVQDTHRVLYPCSLSNKSKKNA